jgi:hypothetical protein
MRVSLGAFALFIGLSLMSCTRDSGRRQETPAQQAGREAYRASKQLKRGAKKAAHDLDTATKQFAEGWRQAKREDHAAKREEGPGQQK